jgi:peptidoglycan/xylan/chitin deacetylase (PgdA/CDA1 family)
MFRRKRLIVFLGIIVFTTASLAVFVSRHYVLPIIMYHSVSTKVPPGNVITVSAKTFERQIAFLKKHNYNVIPLEAASDFITKRKKTPPRTIVLTLDDGYKDNYTYAFPILKKYNFPATIFIILSEVGRSDRLSWAEIKEMQSSGLITFGSHTISHPLLDFIKDNQELIKEISGSKKILEEQLGRKVNTFCYPMGRFSDKARQAVIAAGYKIAVATNPGKKYPDNDIFVLKRLRISENAGNLFVFWLETSGYYNFIREHRHNHNGK